MLRRDLRHCPGFCLFPAKYLSNEFRVKTEGATKSFLSLVVLNKWYPIKNFFSLSLWLTRK